MKKLILSALFSLSVPVMATETPDIKEGMWEISSRASIPAMSVPIPALTMQQCFTRQSMNPENILQQNNCQMNNMDIQTNSVHWQMSCQQEGMQMQGQGQIQYQQTRFSGTFDLTMSGSAAGAMAMHTELTGRYIGKCR